MSELGSIDKSHLRLCKFPIQQTPIFKSVKSSNHQIIQDLLKCRHKEGITNLSRILWLIIVRSEIERNTLDSDWHITTFCSS